VGGFTKGTSFINPRSEHQIRRQERNRRGTTILALVLAIFVSAGTLLYIGARVFIVVESFISLRRVPIVVYQTPTTNFMGYIPPL